MKMVIRARHRTCRGPWLVPVLLAVLCLASFGARSAWLSLPCRGACQRPADHLLIFDEHYYVNAARVIAGVRPPIAHAAYRHAPLGSDPNSEHPQLAKLIMAGFIELLGDGPWAWRLGSLLFGTLAIAGMFALVRWGGGGRGLALGAAALMASDNLMIVQGRIATLDIYVVAAMVWAVALYLRGRPLLAGATAAIGACMKLFALDIVVVLALLELLGWRLDAPGVRLRRLAISVAAMGALFVGLLAALDHVARPYNNTLRRFVGSGPLAHIGHMFTYARGRTGISAHGIASYPWQWLGDYKPIPYLALPRAHPPVHFLGFISPPILLAGLVGMGLALWMVLTASLRGGQGGPLRDALRAQDRQLPILSAAWFMGTFGPFLVSSLALQRTSYLYYMTIVMPGMYAAAVWLAARLRHHAWLLGAWILSILAAAVLLYPFTPVP